jgi:DNA-binding response OmpR family regulator
MTQPDPSAQLPSAPVYVNYFQAGTPAASARILCITEDPAYAEREILPPLRRAGVYVEPRRLNRGDNVENSLDTYHAILLDIGIHNSASFDICRKIRVGTHAPILLVLHSAARADVMQAYRAGADAHVLAPFDPREFLARLSGLLRRRLTSVA